MTLRVILWRLRREGGREREEAWRKRLLVRDLSKMPVTAFDVVGGGGEGSACVPPSVRVSVCPSLSIYPIPCLLPTNELSRRALTEPGLRD